MAMREINLFTYGDSTKPATWSNVPYCLSSALQSMGYRINRIDISLSANRLLNICRRIWNAVARRVLGILHRGDKFAYTFDRTPLFCKEVEKRISAANRKYPNVCCNIFLSFSCYNRYSEAPSILLCDWTFEHLLREQYVREPYACERKYIQLQQEAINNCKYVVSLFEKSAQYIAERSSNPNIVHLGSNVINIIGENHPTEELSSTKSATHNILFVGGYRYREAAVQLVESFDALKHLYPDLKIDIVGQTVENLGISIPDGVSCHGYLDKANPRQQETYYRLFKEASLFINHNPIWAGYSSMIEAMYFYTPVIVSPYAEFVGEFGEQITFGEYCSTFSREELAECIRKVFDSSDRQRMAIDAHNAVKDYTWQSFVEKLVKLIEE